LKVVELFKEVGIIDDRLGLLSVHVRLTNLEVVIFNVPSEGSRSFFDLDIKVAADILSDVELDHFGQSLIIKGLEDISRCHFDDSRR